MVKLAIFLVYLLLAESAFPATYYFNNTGGGANDGSSDADAYTTISQFDALVLSPGDRVLFKDSCTWSGDRLRIQYSGTSSQPIYIGSYYMDGSTEVEGFSVAKPVFDGNSFAVPTNNYAALVEVSSGRSYVILHNLSVTDSGGDGFETVDASHVDIINCDVDGATRSAVSTYSSDSILVQGCDLTDACRIELLGGNWPAALATSPMSSNIIFRENKVHENYGEGIGVYKSSTNVIIEGNVVWANKKAQIYIDHSQYTITRYNMVYGTTDTTFWRYSDEYEDTRPSGGIYTAEESGEVGYINNFGHEIYGNLVAFCRWGIKIGGVGNTDVETMPIYGNTVVDCDYAFAWGSYVGSNVTLRYRNNIAVAITGTSNLIEGTAQGDWDYTGSNTSIPAGIQGSNDQASDTGILDKMTGWQAFTGGDAEVSDWALGASSDAIDNGLTLSGYPYCLDESDADPDVDNLFEIDGTRDIGALEDQGTITMAPTDIETTRIRGIFRGGVLH